MPQVDAGALADIESMEDDASDDISDDASRAFARVVDSDPDDPGSLEVP